MNESINEKYVLRRDSFSHRFCDDLSSVIISYLSFKDKIRLQSVSKQFQRLIYNKQNVLIIKKSGKRLDVLTHLVTKTDENKSSTSDEFVVIINALEIVLKKFAFINEIHFDKYINIINREEVLQTIIENCNQLKTIEFDFCDIKEEVLQSFGLKFGKSLVNIKFINFYYGNDWKPLIKLCPNLLSINGIRIKDFVDENEVLVKKLRKLDNCCLSRDERHLFELMAKRYENSLQSLEIEPTFKDANDRNMFFKDLSLMKSLEFFSITTYDCDYYSKDLIKSIQLMANNCKQLKKITFHLMERKSFDRSNYFESFGNFLNLRELRFLISKIHFPFIEFEGELNINCLKNCKQLTHLEIQSLDLKDDLFKEIHSIVPQLKDFDITTNENITDIALESISKLKNLEVISFDAFYSTLNNFMSVTDSGLLSVINNCQNLKSIQFHKRPNITHKTIDSLIEKALKSPKIDFDHYFHNVGKESESFAAIDLETYNPLPNNLVIVI